MITLFGGRMSMPFILVLVLLAASCGNGPAEELPSGPSATGHFDPGHSGWNRLLGKYVHPPGQVDYKGLLKEKPALETYLDGLRSVRLEDFRKWNRVGKEAFWINVYNAYAVKLVLDHYPVASIRDIGSLLHSVFDREFIPLEHLVPGHDPSLPLSLNEVEHDLLPAVSPTPLYHFAIVCASWSCPQLRAEAYLPGRLEGQLEDQARKFLANGSKNGQNTSGGELEVSKIFHWSEHELEKYPGGIPGILKKFGPPGVKNAPGLPDVRLTFRDYDWSLNEWKPARSKNP